MFFFFFFNDTATTEIYTLSLHDALPICGRARDPLLVPLHREPVVLRGDEDATGLDLAHRMVSTPRSEEHTSELQSRQYLVCRLLLEKKKKKPDYPQCSTSNIPHTACTSS